MSSVREGGTRLHVPNSGLEVWLYDDANRERIRAGSPSDAGFGGMPPQLEERMREGLVLGYSLAQDDELDVAIHVGAPLTDTELATARWLEPQRAFLRAPSGALCLESNDASRLGPEQPGEQGARANVPPGDYRVTLYRLDHEAIDRERLTWDGPQEVIVLTPGGGPEDAADFLLPFHERRDTSWVGKYTIEGKRAQGLVWFGDGWDTFVVNLDTTAAARLGLVPGSCIRTEVPAAGITLVSTFAKSWSDAERLPPPAGVGLEEYGYAALQGMGDWDGAEALFCRRQITKARVVDEHHHVWLPATIDVLDVRAQELTGRQFTAIDLATKTYFGAGLLTGIFSDAVLEVPGLDELPLAAALGMVDEKLVALDLAPVGDVTWAERVKARTVETSARLYAGRSDAFAIILTSDACFEVMFLSELDDASWVCTGYADEIPRRIMKIGPKGLPVPNPRVRFATMDKPLAQILEAHEVAVGAAGRGTVAAPKSQGECAAALDRFLTVATE